MRRPISKALRERVRNRYGGRCGYCGEKPKKLHIDHIIPVAMGAKEEGSEENLMPSCPQCNNYKTTFTVEEFRLQIEQQLARADRYSVNYRMAKKYGQVKETPSPVVFHFEKEGPW